MGFLDKTGLSPFPAPFLSLLSPLREAETVACRVGSDLVVLGEFFCHVHVYKLCWVSGGRSRTPPAPVAPRAACSGASLTRRVEARCSHCGGMGSRPAAADPGAGAALGAGRRRRHEGLSLLSPSITPVPHAVRR